MNTNVPLWLGEGGKAKWRKLIKQLPSITEAQLDTLALLSNAWDMYHTAVKDLAKNGAHMKAANGRLFINPSFNIMVEERKTIVKLSKLFGLSPDEYAGTEPPASPFRDLIEGDDHD